MAANAGPEMLPLSEMVLDAGEPGTHVSLNGRRLRVLHLGKFYPPFRGGMETHMQALAEGIASDVDLEVVVANGSQTTSDEQIGAVRVRRLARQFTLAGAPVSLGIRSAIRKFKPDIVHVHLPNPAACFSLLASGFRGRIVATYHSDIIRQKVLGELIEPGLRMLLNRCSAIIATTNNYVHSSRTLTAFADRCRVIHLGIDPTPFAEPNQAHVRAIRQRFGNRIVLAVGRLIYYKGYHYLIDAMKNVDAHLIIIGEGPLRGELLDHAHQSDVAGRVSLLGEIPQEEMVDYYHAARVFALPSIARSEAFGIVQLEAMAAGLPVVNTQLSSGVPFVSPNGLTGITVKPRNSVALAAAIHSLLADPSNAAQLGSNGRRRVLERFTSDQMCRQTLALYKAVATN